VCFGLAGKKILSEKNGLFRLHVKFDEQNGKESAY
jgi:hypothetical protein